MSVPGWRTGSSRRWRRALMLATLAAAVAFVGTGTGVVAGPGGSAAHAGARPVASPATCGRHQGLCPAEVTLGKGAWCWFADPRAVHIDRHGIDEVIVGWVSPTGQVIVESIDRSGQAHQVAVAQNYADDHNAPALSVEPDDRITVYWSTHNGHHLYYQTTRRPGDITSWDHWHDMASNTPGGWGFTYPNPVILAGESNRHYLFWRGGDWEPSFSVRANAGAWGPAHVLIDVPSRRPYAKVASNGRNRIGLAFTDGHPDNDVTSIYFADIHNGGVYSASGRRLGTLGGRPIVPSAATIVYDAAANGDVRSWLQDVAYDHAGHPVILYSIYPRGASAQYWYARWDGHRWLRHFIVDAGPPIAVDQPHYVGGAVLDHARAGIAYISVMVGTHHQIARWVTGDGGQSWSSTVLSTGGEAQVRPIVAQELPGADTAATTIFAMRGVYHDYWHFRTSVVMLSSRFSVVDQPPKAGGASRLPDADDTSGAAGD